MAQIIQVVHRFSWHKWISGWTFFLLCSIISFRSGGSSWATLVNKLLLQIYQKLQGSLLFHVKKNLKLNKMWKDHHIQLEGIVHTDRLDNVQSEFCNLMQCWKRPHTTILGLIILIKWRPYYATYRGVLHPLKLTLQVRLHEDQLNTKNFVTISWKMTPPWQLLCSFGIRTAALRSYQGKVKITVWKNN